MFCDLRGFTAFAETAEPEEVMAVLRDYHAVMGELIFALRGTLERFTGDGLMVFFNDPVPCDDPARAPSGWRVAMRERVERLAAGLATARPRARLRPRHRAGLRHGRARSASRGGPITRRSAP